MAIITSIHFLSKRTWVQSKIKNKKGLIKPFTFGIISVLNFFKYLLFSVFAFYIKKNNICSRNHLTLQLFSFKSKNNSQNALFKEDFCFSFLGIFAPLPDYSKTGFCIYFNLKKYFNYLIHRHLKNYLSCRNSKYCFT